MFQWRTIDLERLVLGLWLTPRPSDLEASIATHRSSVNAGLLALSRAKPLFPLSLLITALSAYQRYYSLQSDYWKVRHKTNTHHVSFSQRYSHILSELIHRKSALGAIVSGFISESFLDLRWDWLLVIVKYFLSWEVLQICGFCLQGYTQCQRHSGY